MVNKSIVANKQKKKVHETILPELISAALVNDITAVQSISFSIAKSLRPENPELARLITDVVGNFSVSKNPMRAMGLKPLPTDIESYSEIATVSLPNDLASKPVLAKSTQYEVDTFLSEWKNQNLLLSKNIKPSTSMLFIGAPGTGKTMSAKYIASTLKLNLVTLDLSISMSSLLGRTGQNIKKIFSYARKNPCVLLLDEFDAIAKRRDDPTDLGEIKRVVNVLLLELENWPATSIVIATSNHPELLDRAVWRRFDKVVEIENPEFEQRIKIITDNLHSYGYDLSDEEKNLVEIASIMLVDKNASDLAKFSERIVRKMLLEKSNFEIALIEELEATVKDKKFRGKFCFEMKNRFGKQITLRELARITGLSTAGVQHHLKNID